MRRHGSNAIKNNRSLKGMWACDHKVFMSSITLNADETLAEQPKT